MIESETKDQHEMTGSAEARPSDVEIEMTCGSRPHLYVQQISRAVTVCIKVNYLYIQFLHCHRLDCRENVVVPEEIYSK